MALPAHPPRTDRPHPPYRPHRRHRSTGPPSTDYRPPPANVGHRSPPAPFLGKVPRTLSKPCAEHHAVLTGQPATRQTVDSGISGAERSGCTPNHTGVLSSVPEPVPVPVTTARPGGEAGQGASMDGDDGPRVRVPEQLAAQPSVPGAELCFAVLGPVRVRLGGTPLPSGSPQQRALLAALLLRDGRTATASELIDAIWGRSHRRRPWRRSVRTPPGSARRSAGTCWSASPAGTRYVSTRVRAPSTSISRRSR